MMKTMKLDRLNQWLSLVANFGVIAGFILVAYQLNLNTESIRLRNAMDLNRDTSAAEIAYMGETTHVAFANAIFRPADMTDEQMGQVWAYLNIAMNSTLNTWIAYESGFATKDDWEGALRIASNYLAFKVGQIYWKHTKEGYFPPEFVASIDAALSNMDRDLLAHQFKNIVTDVRQIGLNPSMSDDPSR